MSANVIDLSQPYANTALSNFEVWMMGESFWAWFAMPQRLGWASPASALDYTTNPALLGLSGVIMRDFVAWTSGRIKLVPDGLHERIAELIANARLDEHLSDRVAEALNLGGAA